MITLELFALFGAPLLMFATGCAALWIASRGGAPKRSAD